MAKTVTTDFLSYRRKISYTRCPARLSSSHRSFEMPIRTTGERGRSSPMEMLETSAYEYSCLRGCCRRKVLYREVRHAKIWDSKRKAFAYRCFELDLASASQHKVQDGHVGRSFERKMCVSLLESLTRVQDLQRLCTHLFSNEYHA